MSSEPFVREARADIDRLSDGLVELEGAGDRETVDELFRRAHGLKGNLRMEGYDGAADLAHALEDALDAVRGGAEADSELVDRSLAATDTLAAMVDEIDRADRPSTDPEPATAALAAAVDDSAGTASGAGADATTATDRTGSERSASTDPLSEAVETDDESVEAALDAASEFDDLDALVEEMDEDGDFETLEGGGSFDDLLDEGEDDAGTLDEGEDDVAGDTDDAAGDADDAPPVTDRETVLGGRGDSTAAAGADDSAAAAATDAPTSPVETPSGSAPRKDQGDTSAEDEGDVAPPEEPPSREEDPFTWVKSAVDEETPVSDLQAEVEAESFGEFDDEDDMTIRELIELDPEDSADDSGEADDHGGPDDSVAFDEADATDDSVAAGDSDTVADATNGRAATERDLGVDTERADAEAGEESASVAEAAEGGAVDPTGGAAEAADADGATARSDSESGDPLDALHEVYEALADDDPGAGETYVDAAESGTDSADGSPADTGDAADSTDVTNTADTTATDTTASDTAGRSTEESVDVDLSDVRVGEPDAGTETFDAGRTEMDAFESRFEQLFDGDEDPSRPADAAPTIEASALSTAAFRPDSERTRVAAETTRTQSITVDAESAERLLSLAERLSMQARELRETVDDPEARETAEALTDSVDRLQRTVMEVRLLPLSTVTDGLARVVRDATRETDTRAELTVEGADVSLDRSIIDRIGDPIRHLVRNAVDHGIEPPAEREAAGKPRTGTVTVRARREGDRAVVEVVDDGRGIDAEAVREAAVAEGVLDREAARALSPEESYELLFRPGLSTAAEVTATSGRGVGMDVVEQTVTGLGGDVEVESRRGEGTTVRLRLPVSVVVTEVLFVEADGERFAVPVDDVRRVGPAGGARVVDGGLLAAGAERTVELAAAMGVEESGGDGRAGASGDDATVVGVAAGGESVALRCDRAGERREAVITPYDDLLVDVPGISGATTDAGGRVVHVLDVTEL